MQRGTYFPQSLWLWGARAFLAGQVRPQGTRLRSWLAQPCGSIQDVATGCPDGAGPHSPLPLEMGLSESVVFPENSPASKSNDKMIKNSKQMPGPPDNSPVRPQNSCELGLFGFQIIVVDEDVVGQELRTCFLAAFSPTNPVSQGFISTPHTCVSSAAGSVPWAALSLSSCTPQPQRRPVGAT